MHHLKSIIMPMIIGSRDIIKKDTNKHINEIPSSPCLQEIKKIALYRTAHLLIRVSFVFLFRFYGISTFVGYLMRNLFLYK